jgi:hypothetical protein
VAAVPFKHPWKNPPRVIDPSPLHLLCRSAPKNPDRSEPCDVAPAFLCQDIQKNLKLGSKVILKVWTCYHRLQYLQPFTDVANYPSSSNFERAFHEVTVLFPLLPPCNELTTPTTPSDDVALKMADPSPFLAKKRTSELSSLCRERKSETRFRCAIIMRTKSLSQTTLESQDLVVYYSRQAMMTSQERKLRAPPHFSFLCNLVTRRGQSVVVQRIKDEKAIHLMKIHLTKV